MQELSIELQELTNGLDESTNQTVTTAVFISALMLSRTIGMSASYLFSYRTTAHTSTQLHTLLLGREAMLPVQLQLALWSKLRWVSGDNAQLNCAFIQCMLHTLIGKVKGERFLKLI